MRADAHQVSAEPLSFLTDRFGDIAFLDHGDLSSDATLGGVRRHLCTQALFGHGHALDRSCFHQGRGLEDVEQPYDATGRYRPVCIRNRAAAVFGEVGRSKYPME